MEELFAEGEKQTHDKTEAEGEHDLVALGEVEQRAQSFADGSDDVLDRGLAVGGADDRGGASGDGVDLCGANLGGAAAEPAVSGNEVSGQLREGSGHGGGKLLLGG